MCKEVKKMSGFTRILHNSPEYKSIKNAVENRRIPMGIIGLTNVHKAHYITALYEDTCKKSLVLCPDEATAIKMTSDLNTFCGGALHFVARDYNFRPGEAQSREFEQKRIGVLSNILDGDYTFIICSVEAAIQLTMPRHELKRRHLTIDSNTSMSLFDITKILLAAGYVRTHQVDAVGQFSVRGGILDVFTPAMNEPCRIEFWDEDVDSISLFDPETQRRTEILDSLTITPSAEVLFDSPEIMKERIEAFSATVKGKGSVKVKASLAEDIDKLEHFLHLGACDRYLGLAYDKLETIFDYMEGNLLFVCESASVKAKFTTSHQLIYEDIREMFEQGILTKGIDRYVLEWSEVLAHYESFGCIYTDNLTRGSFDTPVKELVGVTAGQLPRWDGTLSVLMEDLAPALRDGFTAVVFAGTEKSAKELAYDLETEDIKAMYFPVPPAEFTGGTVNVLPGSVSFGIEYTGLKFMLFTYGIGGSTQSKKKVKSAFKKGKSITSLEDISQGDYIVHTSYGIGVFDGIKTMKVDGVTKDFIKINYRGTDVLYLPVTQLDMVSKYVSPGDTDKIIKLNKLGGDEWKNTKAKVKGAVKDMAEELTKLYAKRMSAPGFAFSPDIDMQNDFERRFEFEETDDQIEAVNEIKADMERSAPMDRLLCGDVGFGKTEVALRAAFKCIADGKQCAILVPTTILAFQHYQTIKKRFDGFPVEIEMISRFRTATEKTKIKKGLKRGSIDIIVGTHSLIAKGIEFNDLGLLIVDEEQRFGVGQKERIKERHPNVDVLTLSATPIPRTLNMAMSGIRDMSVLEIPPIGRHPVQTYVLAHDMGVLAEAMERELRRGGQVYYLINNIEKIYHVAEEISQYLPEAKIGVGHGKMSEQDLSEVWRQLLENEIDILVCTTIIETGVDVPNANTLIIENADKLGLAQLHQIRGRVGRSQRRAFAYFTYPGYKALPQVAQHRLSAIREFTEFGAGFKVAQRDLEIRGAGNILGAKQHGHLEAVGYEMYLELLSEAITEEKTGEIQPEKKECNVDISIDAHIPESYIDSAKSRIFMYKRIASIETGEDAMDVMDEFIDRFGTPPKSVKGLVDVALLRAYAARLGIYEIKQADGFIIASLDSISPEIMFSIGASLGRRGVISLTGTTPTVKMRLGNSTPIETIKLLIKALSSALGEEAEGTE